MDYATERLDLRTAEAEATEAEELQNALNQPNDGGVAGGGGGEPAAGAGGAGGGAAEDGASETTTKGGAPYFWRIEHVRVSSLASITGRGLFLLRTTDL